MLHFPQTLRLTNLANFWRHSQIQMALQQLPEIGKKAIAVSSTKRNSKLVMKLLVYAILSFTSQYLRIESYCSLTKNVQFVLN